MIDKLIGVAWTIRVLLGLDVAHLPAKDGHLFLGKNFSDALHRVTGNSDWLEAGIECLLIIFLTGAIYLLARIQNMRAQDQ